MTTDLQKYLKTTPKEEQEVVYARCPWWFRKRKQSICGTDTSFMEDGTFLPKEEGGGPSFKINKDVSTKDLNFSPSCEKLVEAKNSKEYTDKLMKDCDNYFFLKSGKHFNSGQKTNTPFIFKRRQFNYLANKIRKLQPAALERRRIFSTRGREFETKKLCVQAEKIPTEDKSLNTKFKEECRAKVILQLAEAQKQRLDNLAEINDFNRSAGACQVQAILGLQLEQKKALEKLPCKWKDPKFEGGMAEIQAEHAIETAERIEEQRKRQIILDIVKFQTEEKDLIKKIEWELLQNEAQRTKYSNFESAFEGLKRVKEREIKNAQFRTDVKNQISYDLKLIGYRAQEARERLAREDKFNREKAAFILANKKKAEQRQEELHARYLFVCDLISTTETEKKMKDTQLAEWIIYSTEKKLKQREEDEKQARKEADIRILKERKMYEESNLRESKLAKEQEIAEYQANQAWLKYQDTIRDAHNWKKKLIMDQNKFIILQQYNNFEKQRKNEVKEKFNEGLLIRKFQKGYDDMIKRRQTEKLAEHREWGLPKVYTAQLQRQYKL